MAANPRKSLGTLIARWLTATCIVLFGMAHASTLTVTIRKPIFDIHADQVPLINILKEISDRTSIAIKSEDPMRDPVSFHFSARSVEDCLRRLLANRNYALLYKKTEDNRFVPVEVHIIGSNTMKTINAGAPDVFRFSPEESTNASPPEDPTRRYRREDFTKVFKDADDLLKQISTDALTKDSNLPHTDGLQIKRVSSNSIFNEIGIRAGDIIHDVNGFPVSTAEELMDALRSAFEGQPMIRVERLKNDGMIDPIYIELH